MRVTFEDIEAVEIEAAEGCCLRPFRKAEMGPVSPGKEATIPVSERQCLLLVSVLESGACIRPCDGKEEGDCVYK